MIVEDACFHVEGPNEATAWTEKRLDDIELGVILMLF